jgi:hypothetical protein
VRQRKRPRLAEHALFLVAGHKPEKRHGILEPMRRHGVVEILHVAVVPVARHPELRVGTARDDLRPG